MLKVLALRYLATVGLFKIFLYNFRSLIGFPHPTHIPVSATILPHFLTSHNSSAKPRMVSARKQNGVQHRYIHLSVERIFLLLDGMRLKGKRSVLSPKPSPLRILHTQPTNLDCLIGFVPIHSHFTRLLFTEVTSILGDDRTRRCFLCSE